MDPDAAGAAAAGYGAYYVLVDVFCGTDLIVRATHHAWRPGIRSHPRDLPGTMRSMPPARIFRSMTRLSHRGGSARTKIARPATIDRIRPSGDRAGGAVGSQARLASAKRTSSVPVSITIGRRR
jgi:hypothetical protein